MLAFLLTFVAVEEGAKRTGVDLKGIEEVEEETGMTREEEKVEVAVKREEEVVDVVVT